MKLLKIRFFNSVVVIFIIALLVGCNSWLYRDYGVGAIKIDVNSDVIALRNAITKHLDENHKEQGFVQEECFNSPISGVADTETKCMQQRNASVALLLNASDDLCQEHLKTIFGNEAKVNIITGSLATFFAGAATVANVATAKTTLSALSGFSSAERSLINETVYKDMLVTAVTKKIREARAAKATAIVPGSFKKTMDDYPMVLAIHDVIDYHYSCSFMYGLEKALEEGSQSGLEAKKAKLEQEKHSLELYVDNRKRMLRGAASEVAAASGAIEADNGIAGANKRINAIEAQLLNLTNAGALATVQAAASSVPSTGK